MATFSGLANVGVSYVFVALLLGACAGDPTTTPDGHDGAGASSGAQNAGSGTSGTQGSAGGASGSGAGGNESPGNGGSGGAGAATAGAGAAGSAGVDGGVGGSLAGAGGVDGGVGGSLAGAGGSMAGAGGSLAGAGGNGASGSAGEGASGGAGNEALSFAADIWPIFAAIRDPAFVYPTGDVYEGCTTSGVCHGGQNPGADLHMPDVETAYDDLLNVPSVSRLCDETILVVPGNPTESCLILFYEGRLRDELDWVDDTEIDLVRRWIADGALP